MDPKEASAQERREQVDPHEESMAPPVAIVSLIGCMVIFGLYYIGASDISIPVEYGDQRTVKDLMTQTAPAPGAVVDGAAVYATRCVVCHQAAGTGLAGVFPPLAGSEWVAGNPDLVAKIVLHGIQGALTVKGTTYNGAMPSFKGQLTDAEIAAVTTFVRKKWGNAAPPVTVDVVTRARSETASRNEAWKGDAELGLMK